MPKFADTPMTPPFYDENAHGARPAPRWTEHLKFLLVMGQVDVILPEELSKTMKPAAVSDGIRWVWIPSRGGNWTIASVFDELPADH